MNIVQAFMHGSLAMASAVAAAFFLRFWRSGHDRLFLFFSAAFAMFAMNWTGFVVAGSEAESRHYFFVVRLLAFILIIVGIFDKNRRSTSR